MPSISRYFATIRRAILMPSVFSKIKRLRVCRGAPTCTSHNLRIAPHYLLRLVNLLMTLATTFDEAEKLCVLH